MNIKILGAALVALAALAACTAPTPSHRSDGSKVCGGIDAAGRPLPGTGFICHPPRAGGTAHTTSSDPGYDRIAGAIDKMSTSVDKLTTVVVKLDERVTNLETGKRPATTNIAATGSGSPQPTYSTADSMAFAYEAARKGNGMVGGVPFESFAAVIQMDPPAVSKTLFGQMPVACDAELLRRLEGLATIRKGPDGRWVRISSSAPTTCAELGRVYLLGSFLVTPTWKVLKIN